MLRIEHDDAIFLVLDKPAGVPCTAERDGRHPAIADWLIAHDPALQAIGELGEAGLVHRLDNDTSGCLIVAKTPEAYDSLRAQFDARTVAKEYLALLVGSVPEQIVWSQPIAHHPRDARKMMVCEIPSPLVGKGQGEGGVKGQRAETVVHRLVWFPASADHETPYSLCRVTISTGVRHQIRVHAAAAGFPLAGDRLYQTPRTRRCDRLPLPRHFLHAMRIVFTHPITNESITVECPLASELHAILQQLRGRARLDLPIHFQDPTPEVDRNP